jgi:hypothetical protein
LFFVCSFSTLIFVFGFTDLRENEEEIPSGDPEGVSEGFEQDVEMLLDESERFPEELAGAGLAVAERQSRVPERSLQNKDVALQRAKKRWHSVGAGGSRAQQKFPRREQSNESRSNPWLPWRGAPSASREESKFRQVGDPRVLGGVLEIQGKQDLLSAQVSIGQGQSSDLLDWSVSAQDE